MRTFRAIAGVLLFPLHSLAVAASTDGAQLRSAVAGVGVPFVENLGQAHPDVRFTAQTFAGTLFVSRQGELVLSLPDGAAPREPVLLRESVRGGKVRGVRGLERSGARVSFFLGNDPARWRSGVPTWDLLTLGEVYPGVELRLRARARSVEKIFHVRPGGGPGAIEMAVRGAKRLAVTGDGRLAADTGRGTVHYSRPAAWQETPEGRRPVEVAYRVKGNRYGFTVGEYDRERELVIDPFVSTYLGGSGQEDGYALDVWCGIETPCQQGGSAAAVFVAGRTASFAGWASQPGGIVSGGSGGGYDAFVARLDRDLSSLTVVYLGGGGEDWASDVVVHPVGGLAKVFVTGSTASGDFPATANGLPGRSGGRDAFVARLDENLQTLEDGRYVGGAGNDDGEAIAARENFIYIAGPTRSTSLPEVVPGALNYGFVALLLADSLGLVRTRYVDQCHGLALRPSDGRVYVAGERYVGTGGARYEASIEALSASLETEVGYQKMDQGAMESGPSGVQYGRAVAWSPRGVYLAGATTCVPACNPPNGGPQDAFVVRLEEDLNGPLDTLPRAILAGSDYDRAMDVQVVGSTDVYLLGFTRSNDFPTTPGALQPTGYRDLFLARFDSALGTPGAPLAATCFGGNGQEEIWGHGLAIAGNDLFVAATTGSTNLPYVDPASAQPTPGGSWDAFVARLDLTLMPPQEPRLDVQPGAIDFGNVAPNASSPRTVTIRNHGGATLSVSSIVVEDPVSPAYFTLDLNGGATPCGVPSPTLAPGATCTVNAVFAPTAVTPPRTATLTVTSNAGQVVVQLTGSSGPEIAFLPATLVLGLSAPVGGSAAATFTIQNTGTADLHVESVALDLLGTPAGTFSLTFGSPGFCSQPPLTIRPGSECTVLVTFRPPAEATYQARVHVLSDDSDEPDVQVAITGIGVAGDVDLDGVSDVEEQGPSGQEASYDGNGDGLPDRQQANVASLHSLDRQKYLTISTSVGTLEATAPFSSSAGAPASHVYPFGFYQFTVVVPNPGDSAEVRVQLQGGGLPAGQATWMKHGSSGWYDLAGVTPVAYAAGSLRFQLKDGGAGDGDGAADRRILDPGAPAWPQASTAAPEEKTGGCGCGSAGEPGIWLLGLVWLAAARRGPRRR